MPNAAMTEREKSARSTSTEVQRCSPCMLRKKIPFDHCAALKKCIAEEFAVATHPYRSWLDVYRGRFSSRSGCNVMRAFVFGHRRRRRQLYTLKRSHRD